MPAVVERVLGILGLAEEVAGIDTGLGELVGEVARTDTGSEELVGEAGLTHTCHRTARSHQVVDHKTCTASSSPLFENRPGLNLLCFCSCCAILPCTHEGWIRSEDRRHWSWKRWKCSGKKGTREGSSLHTMRSTPAVASVLVLDRVFLLVLQRL